MLYGTFSRVLILLCQQKRRAQK